LPAPDECISHFTRLYLKKLKELRKLKRYLHVALPGSRIFMRAWQQVEAGEYCGPMRLTEALVPARVWVLHRQRAGRTGGKRGEEQEENKRRIRAQQEVKERADRMQPPCKAPSTRLLVACGADAAEREGDRFQSNPCFKPE